MIKLKTWVGAARLRTLPLSVSGIFVGTGLAVQNGVFDGAIFGLALLTTLGLQVLSNFANDYGDGIKGTDNHERVGPMRALQSGIISDKEMRNAIILTSLLTLVFAVLLIYEAFGSKNLGYSLLFLLLGIAAIGAAIKYTVGKSAYGYRGLGDIFVFLFFGLLSVLGTFFLFEKELTVLAFFPAIAIGLLSTAVLNLNNMRDQLSDERAGKHTLVVKLGAAKAKKYHLSLIIVAFVMMLIYLALSPRSGFEYLALIAFVPLFLHLKTVIKNKTPQSLDPELKKVALSTFFLALLFFGLSWM